MKKLIVGLIGLILITGLEGGKRKAGTTPSSSKRPALDLKKKIPGSSPARFINLGDEETFSLESFQERLQNYPSGIDIAEVFTIDDNLNPKHHYFFMNELRQSLMEGNTFNPINRLPITRKSIQAFYLNDIDSKLERVPLEHVYPQELELIDSDTGLPDLPGRYYGLSSLADQYMDGKIGNKTPHDYLRVQEFYEQAAQQNIDLDTKALAQANLGTMYLTGKTVCETHQSCLDAQEHTKNAAKQDVNLNAKAIAQMNLGYMYLIGMRGSKTPQNYLEAKKHFTKAAEQDVNVAAKTQAQEQLEKMKV